MDAGDTLRVEDLPKIITLGLLQRISFRESDVRLDIGPLSSSKALNNVLHRLSALQLASNCVMLLAYAAGPDIPADEPSRFFDA